MLAKKLIITFSIGVILANCQYQNPKDKGGIPSEELNLVLGSLLAFSSYHSTHKGTIVDSNSSLEWKMCTQGQTYDSSGDNCMGGGGTANTGSFGATPLQYCNQNLDWCNQISPPTLTNPTSLGYGGVSQAYNSCNSDSTAGYTDWRVAGYDELNALVAGGSFDALSVVFPNIAQDYYWTSWSDAKDTSGQTAVAINFSRTDYGTKYSFAKQSTHYVRCVRNYK